MNSKKTHFYNCSFIYFKIFKIFNSFIFILLYMLILYLFFYTCFYIPFINNLIPKFIIIVEKKQLIAVK